MYFASILPIDAERRLFYSHGGRGSEMTRPWE